ncbi:UDP-N-acetylmuramate dehydrogenase [Candidatus Uhrbacteria bacterium]|nr:UDP-N-acetylmuramate dehydrogenase [Candidatus Uhrbacteria bacterium]
MNQIISQFHFIFGSRLKENEPMSKHTNFRIGGTAKWFVEVRSVNELKQVLKIKSDQNIPYFIFGGGSNILVNDKPFEGIAIKIAMRDVVINGNRVRVESGALSSSVARKTAKAGLSGLTWAISLPGTIGGAVRGNAGCFGGETKDYLVEVELLRDGEVITVKKDDLHFSYRDSVIKHNNDIILSATFELEKDDSKKLLVELDEKLSARKTSQPLDAGSAGCMFKNFEIKSDDELQILKQKLDLPIQMIEKRRISVGWLIDQLDLKGKQIGGAKVSEKHGNFVVNIGSATADDVVQLIALIKTRAQNEFGINLEEEVQYVGF